MLLPGILWNPKRGLPIDFEELHSTFCTLQPILPLNIFLRKTTIDLTLRVFVASSLAVYGAAKAVQFLGAAEVETPVNQLTGMQLMWAFFGYSQALPILIGVLQLIGSLMLLLRKTKLLGALLLTPIMVNIILFDIFFEVGWVVINALVYQGCLLIILFFEKEKLLRAWQALTQQVGGTVRPKKIDTLIGYAMGLGLFFFFTASFYLQILEWMGF